MSQHDFDIANQGFAAFRADLNNALKALGSLSSGTAEPATTYANQLWYETDTNTLHIRNEANSAWLDLMVINQTTGSPSFTAGNVGIGTSSPASELHISAATDPKIILQRNDSPTPNGWITSANNAGSFGSAIQLYGNETRFYTTESTGLAMTLDASGSLGLGVTPSAWRSTAKVFQFGLAGALHGTTTVSRTAFVNNAFINSSNQQTYVNTGVAQYYEMDENGNHKWFNAPSGTAGNAITFTQAMTLTSAGDLLVAKTAGATNTIGIEARAIGLLAATRDGAVPLLVNRLTNDGSLVELQQGSVTEGTISVSGTTVSYNGGHLSRWAQLPDNSRPDLLKGTVMSNLDQMSNWDGEANEQLNCVQISTVEGDANVAGVFVAWDSTDDGYNDILLAMTGDMVIRIAAGTTVQRGDLLMSAGDGTAKPQGDDIVRAKTIAKVTSTHVSHTYEDGSYAVPCVLMAC